jgi:ferrous iron transport protein A
MTNKRTLLGNLQGGQSGTVAELEGGHGFAARMAALGFTLGTEITMIQNFGRGPVIVLVRGTRIALGRGEASQVWVNSTNGGDRD